MVLMESINISARVTAVGQSTEQIAAPMRNAQGASSNPASTKQVAPTIAAEKPVQENKAKENRKERSIEKDKMAALREDNIMDSAQKREAERQRLEAVSAKLNEYVQSVQRDLRFSVDADHTVIKVFDRNTQDLIRQIPAEVAVNMADNLAATDGFNLMKARA